MSLKIRQANYFREAKILSSSAIAGLLESITMQLPFSMILLRAVLKHVLFLPIFSVQVELVIRVFCKSVSTSYRCQII